MTTPFVHLTIALGIPLSAGYTLIMFLFRNYALPLTLRISLAYGLGLGLLTLWMMIVGAFQWPFNLLTIGIPLLFLAAVGVIFLMIQRKNNTPPPSPFQKRAQDTSRPTPIAIFQFAFCMILWIYILHNVFYVLWRSVNIPVATWDAIATVAFKAKIFYFEQSLPALTLLPHKTYPLLTPFAQTWIALNLGEWSDLWIKIIFPAAFLSYLVIHYQFLAFNTSRTWALLGCAILLSSNLFTYHATIAYRDFFLMYYNCGAIILLLFWNRTQQSAFMILASFFAGLAAFTKLEGTAFLAIYLILFLIINLSKKSFNLKQKLTDTVKFLVPGFGIGLGFQAYKIFNNVLKEGSGIVDKTGFDFSLEKLRLIPEIIQAFSNDLFFSGNWSMVWLLALLSLRHLPHKKKNREAGLILVALFLFFSLYTTVALLTVNYTWIAGELKSTTLSRLILHFYPLSVLLIILLNHEGTSLNEKIRVP